MNNTDVVGALFIIVHLMLLNWLYIYILTVYYYPHVLNHFKLSSTCRCPMIIAMQVLSKSSINFPRNLGVSGVKIKGWELC